MKKLLTIVAFSLMSVALMAQPGGKNHHSAPRPTRYTVSFESHHGESFSVFIDGELMNRMPQSRVMVSDVTDRTHEVVVVLKRPVQKAAVLNLLPGEPSVVVNVNYDDRIDQLSLYTPSHNRAESRDVAYPEPVPPQGGQQVVVINNNNVAQDVHHDNGGHHGDRPAVRGAKDSDVDAMVVRMNNQSFDSDRLALGKVIVASSNLTASQISRLAETIDFSSSQVDFLKYAYAYCIDKPNYYKTVDILTFSSDKKKVLDYIATQK